MVAIIRSKASRVSIVEDESSPPIIIPTAGIVITANTAQKVSALLPQ
jgi:hypothetical protein